MRKSLSEKFPFHYGWVIVGVGTVCIFACLGLGRFALGMLLPSMASTLKLSYSEMGFISTGNFVGYLAAVFGSGFLVMRIGARRLIFSALLLIASTMMLSAAAQSFEYMLVIYTLTGIGSGAANVPIMALVTAWFGSRMRGRASGFVVIGSGFAIILSGRLLPFVNGIYGDSGWRISWCLLGSVVLVVSFIAYSFLRDKPADVGLRPIGEDTGGLQHAKTGNVLSAVYGSRVLYHLGAIYFLFGFTYVIYATFIVSTLVKERGFSEVEAGNLWSMLGFLSLFSGPVFGSLSDKLSRRAGFAIVFSLQTVSYLLIASGWSGLSLYLSISLFGLVAWSIPSIMAAAVGDYVGPAQMPRAFGLVTFIFGFGQITGPAAAGLMAEIRGGFSEAFFMAACLAFLAVILSLMLKKPDKTV